MKLDFLNKITNNTVFVNVSGSSLGLLKANELISLDRIYQADNEVLLAKMVKQDLKVDCIYIDPPFSTNTVFKDKHGNTAYDDKMVLDEFLLFFQKRAILAHSILRSTGFFWIHIDQKMSHYLKIICDEIFGFDNFVADIVTSRVKKNHTKSTNFNVANDNLLVYRKSPDAILCPLFKASNKKPYWHAFDAKGQGEAKIFDSIVIAPPTGTHWRWSQQRIDNAMRDGTLRLNNRGRPEYLVNTKQKKIDTNWMDLSGYSFKTGYPTEKNVEILKRILLASTNEGDTVLDFFAGSGTTIQACLDLNRHFIGCDKGEQPIKTMKARFGSKMVKKL